MFSVSRLAFGNWRLDRMKRFHFSLESLLRLKEQMLNASEARRQRIESDIVECKLRRETTVASGRGENSTDSWSQRSHWMDFLVAEIDRIDERLVALRDDLRVATDEYRELYQETEALRQIRERKWVEHRNRQQRVEESTRQETILRWQERSKR